MSLNTTPLIPKRGGYMNLKRFQVAGGRNKSVIGVDRKIVNG